MRRHLNLIQFSRVLIPIFVVLFHVKAFMNHYFQYNFLALANVSKSGGVYYFFVLSGFMAYYLYNKRFRDTSYIKDYLYGRFIRIYPVYWLLTLLILPFYLFFPSLGFADDISMSQIITSILLIPNKSDPLVGVAWSLVHTVFFYIVFILFFMKHSLSSRMIILLWLIFSVIFGVNFVSIDSLLLKFIFNIYNLMFLAGILCAYLVIKKRVNQAISWILAISGVVAFPLAWVNEQLHLYPLNFGMVITIASMLILIGFASIDLQKEISLPKVATFLGEASFSIYLVHYYAGTAFSLILSRVFPNALPNAVIAIMLIFASIASGCFVYAFFEKPIHKKLKRYWQKRKESVLMERLSNNVDQLTN